MPTFSRFGHIVALPGRHPAQQRTTFRADQPFGGWLYDTESEIIVVSDAQLFSGGLTCIEPIAVSDSSSFSGTQTQNEAVAITESSVLAGSVVINQGVAVTDSPA